MAELRAAAHYYDTQNRGLGLRFIDAVENAFVRLKNNPSLFRVLEGDVRKCSVTRVPYGVLFRERAEEIEIVAVMHLRRDPDYWKDQI
jgi:toxin ParE1/3/4